MNSRTVKAVDLLIHISALCIIFGVCLIFLRETEQAPEPIPHQVPQREIPKIIPDITPIHKDPEITSEFEEVFEASALFYAIQPIGRYYITAYSHLETGSKLTASGGRVHQGNITTCAADPRYHKFGEYLEVGGRIYRVEDTGSAVKKRHIDIYIPDLKTVKRYNSHYETIYRVTFPFGKPQD